MKAPSRAEADFMGCTAERGPMMRFTIPGEPHAQGRGRAVRRGKHAGIIDPATSFNWKATAQQHMAAAMSDRPPLTGPVRLWIVARFTLPRSKWRKRSPVPESWSTCTKDADNIAKAVMDAGNGVLWLDDRQVVDLRVQKRTAAQGEPGRVIVEVQEIEE